jgi:hypothetical protein
MRHGKENRVRSLTTVPIGAIFLTGCIPSLHPLFTGDDLVFDHRLIGVWAEADSKEAWTFQKSGAKEYRLMTIYHPFAIGGKAGGRRSDRFDAHLCRLGRAINRIENALASCGSTYASDDDPGLVRKRGTFPCDLQSY